MHAFDVVEPNWGRIPPVAAAARPERLADGRIRIATSAGPLLVAGLADGVRLTLGETNAPTYPILVAEPGVRPATLSEDADGGVRVAWDDFVLTLTLDPLAFVLARKACVVQRSSQDGHFVRRHRLPPFARTERGMLVSLDLAPGERVYGLGEKWGRLDKAGQLVRSHVVDALGVNADRAYKNTPFAWSPRGWGAFLHTPAEVTHAVGHPLWSHRTYAALVAEEVIDLFLLAGETGADILRAYTDLTGRAPEIPDWSMGVILSKAYYRTPDELLSVAREVRARGMPVETITFDGRAWQDTQTRFAFQWDPARFPDPKAVLDEVRALGLRVCVWEYPLVSEANPLHAEMAAKGWLLRDRRTGAPYRYRFDPEPFGAVLTQLPDSGIVDFTHPDAYAYWRDRHRELFEAGVEMIKSDFGEQVEDDCLAHNGDTGARLRNVYPLLYNACVHEAATLYCPSGAYLLGRATWAGGQRYPGHWGGDPQADWGGLAASLRGGLSWGLSGGPFHATDIGGFYGDTRDPELYVRWTQAAIFFSHIRFHGIGPREPWSYGADAEAAVNAALVLRERLRPRLREAAREASATGLPVQRAMVLACPDDPAAWAFEEQFFCGSDVLVMPCVEPGGRVVGYLPHGLWRRWPDGAVVEGGRVVTLTLGLQEIAAFERVRHPSP